MTTKPRVNRKKNRDKDLAIDYKLTRLILNSEAIRHLNIDTLIKHLDANGELRKEDQIALGIDSSIIANVIKTCQAEWDYHKEGFKILKDDYEGDPVVCQLCDQSSLKYIHQVINKKTNIAWNIGSHCADEFGDRIKKPLKELEALRIKTTALQKLHEQIPGIIPYNEEQQKFFHKSEIILPSPLHNKKQNLITELNDQINKYCKTPQQETLEKIKILFKNNAEQDFNIQVFKEQNQNKLLYPTPKIIHWLRRNDSLNQTILNIRNNNGLIPKTDFYKISETDFIENLLSKINIPYLRIIKKKPITKYIHFKIIPDSNNAILEMNTPEFLTIFTEYIWKEPFNIDIIKKELLIESRLSTKFNSHILIFKQYESVFNELGYNVIINKYVKDDLILKSADSYLKINNEKFLQNIKEVHLNLKVADSIRVKSIIDSSIYKQYDEDSWEKYMDISKNAASLSKNRIEK